MKPVVAQAERLKVLVKIPTSRLMICMWRISTIRILRTHDHAILFADVNSAG